MISAKRPEILLSTDDIVNKVKLGTRGLMKIADDLVYFNVCIVISLPLG